MSCLCGATVLRNAAGLRVRGARRAEALAASKARVSDDGLMNALTPFINQLTPFVDQVTRSVEGILPGGSPDPWKRTAEWKARRLRDEALRVAREVERADLAREAAKARAEEERKQHWESLVSQAAEQEAKARQLVETYGLEKAKEALAAELKAQADALEAKARELAAEDEEPPLALEAPTTAEEPAAAPAAAAVRRPSAESIAEDAAAWVSGAAAWVSGAASEPAESVAVDPKAAYEQKVRGLTHLCTPHVAPRMHRWPLPHTVYTQCTYSCTLCTHCASHSPPLH